MNFIERTKRMEKLLKENYQWEVRLKENENNNLLWAQGLKEQKKILAKLTLLLSGKDA